MAWVHSFVSYSCPHPSPLHYLMRSSRQRRLANFQVNTISQKGRGIVIYIPDLDCYSIQLDGIFDYNLKTKAARRSLLAELFSVYSLFHNQSAFVSVEINILTTPLCYNVSLPVTSRLTSKPKSFAILPTKDPSAISSRMEYRACPVTLLT